MTEKYDEASVRHFEDAERLAAAPAHRYDNAGHLIGFAAECAIKHAVASLGHGTEKLHIPLLIGNAKKHLTGLRSKAMLDVVSHQDFFSKWSVNRRYDADGTTSPELYATWRVSASRALGAAGLRRAA